MNRKRCGNLRMAGKLRLIFRTPNWEDFVHLTCIEIRHCGAGSVQISGGCIRCWKISIKPCRRIGMPSLRRQLELLDRTIEEHYTFPEDRALARIPDPQGLGGSLGVQAVMESNRRRRRSDKGLKMKNAKKISSSRLDHWVPGVRMIRDYEFAWLPKDLAAGITLGMVMVPVGLAFGELAGVPMAGLYAGMLPLIAYALFGSSRQLIIGPDASMAALVAVSRGSPGRRGSRATGGNGLPPGGSHWIDLHSGFAPAPGFPGRFPGQAGHRRFHARPGSGDRRRSIAQSAGSPGRWGDHGGPVSDGLPKSGRDQCHQPGHRRGLRRHHPVLSPLVSADSRTDRGFDRCHSGRLFFQAGSVRRGCGWKHPAGTAAVSDPDPERAGFSIPSAGGLRRGPGRLLRYRGHRQGVCLTQSLSHRCQSGDAGSGAGKHRRRLDPGPAGQRQRFPHRGRGIQPAAGPR